MIMQANLQRGKIATQELVMEAQRRKVDVALVQEPYVGNLNRVAKPPGTRVVQCKSVQDKPVKAAIMIFNDKLEVMIDYATICENIVAIVVRTGEWRIGLVTVYFEGTEPIEPYLGKLREFLSGMNTTGSSWEEMSTPGVRGGGVPERMEEGKSYGAFSTN